MMTARITSDQTKQLNRFVEDAVNRALKDLNPDKDAAQRLIERGGEFQAYVVAGISRFTSKVSDYNLARTLLGQDFISPEDIMKSRKSVVYTDDQLSQFADTVPSQKVLEWCRENSYVLIAGPNRPMSLLEIRRLKSDYFDPKEGGWIFEQVFAQNDMVETRWIMLRKEPVPKSTSKNWNEQKDLLFKTEVTPNMAEVAWCVTTYMAVRNTYLLQNVYFRTSSLGSGGYLVRACGLVDAGGLHVRFWRDDDRKSNLGLSAGRNCSLTT